MGISFVELIEHAAVFLIALTFALRRPARAWQLFWWMAVLIAIITGIEITSGVYDIATQGAGRDMHRWLGHGLFLLLWWVGVATSALCLASLASRPRTAIGTVMLTLALFFLAFAEAVVGYMPARDALGDPAGDETRNRFFVLHYVALPVAIGLCISGLALLTRPPSKRLSQANDKHKLIEVRPSDNPYRSPEAE